jgi:peptidoglycan/xylan/chitin deacetylase (PgdA/CDA1 family)
MIGVLSKPEDREVVEEFFQLFKTPWEFYNPGHRYDVLVVTDGKIPETDASLIVVYGTEKSSLDICGLGGVEIQGSDVVIEWGKETIPIYGKAITFSNPNQPILSCSKTREPIGYETRKGEQRVLRIGYNLFEEVLFLLSEGQPPQNALLPTLDLHIEMLRTWIVETGLELVEIPPVPHGHRFIACLTHDVDFISIRDHFMDHSMIGFLYRATIGMLYGVARRKVPLSKLLENLKAVFSLPLVFLGISSDPWDQFDRYLEMEQGLGSTYFFIPFKNKAGDGFREKRGSYRAAKYDVDDAVETIQKLLSKGCEIGVHGIDAWHSVEKAREELRRIWEKTDSQNGIGNRTHWLFRNEQSFEILDRAGYLYDSSFGYNETIGFRAGTSQVFKPVGVKHLLEIPLHIQDVALFGSGRMNGSENQSEEVCRKVIDRVSDHGGVLTVLWHQRSLGPERLWGDFYEKMIRRLKEKEAWFATANEVVAWFNLRRAAVFEKGMMIPGKLENALGMKGKTILPPLALRRYGREGRLPLKTPLAAAQHLT